jgi:two-component system alkaline phosphatase synthesis response regulator PhoP
VSAARILLVEDEANLRELVKARLEQNDYEVITACDGYEALSRARDDLPDLMILDLMIPKIDGYTVCRMLRFSRTEPLPIIMFTARSSPDDMRRGLDTGADAYVVKPFEPSMLLGKIGELLAARKVEQEKKQKAEEQARVQAQMQVKPKES